MKTSRVSQNSWLRVRPVAHRGLHNDSAAENSLSAYRNAVAKNYPIEIDVHLTADGDIAVFHDDSLTRMCGIDRTVESMTAEELRACKLGGTEDTIPMLSDVFETVAGKVPLLIEIKNHRDIGPLEEKLVLALRDYRGEFAIQSFSPFILKKIRQFAPDFLRGQLATHIYGIDVSRFAAWILRTLRSKYICRPDFVSYNITNLPDKHVTSRKCPLLCWTVSDEANEKKAHTLGGNIIFENFIPNGK